MDPLIIRPREVEGSSPDPTRLYVVTCPISFDLVNNTPRYLGRFRLGLVTPALKSDWTPPPALAARIRAVDVPALVQKPIDGELMPFETVPVDLVGGNLQLQHATSTYSFGIWVGTEAGEHALFQMRTLIQIPAMLGAPPRLTLTAERMPVDVRVEIGLREGA